MKPAQLTACIHAAIQGGTEAEELAELLCIRFGGDTLPKPEAFYRGMEELRGVERTARESMQGKRDGQ